MREEIGLGKRVPLLKEPEKSPIDNSSDKLTTSKKKFTINSWLTGNADPIVNRYLVSYRPRGWTADKGKEKEENDRTYTLAALKKNEKLDDPIFRTNWIGESPSQKTKKKELPSNKKTTSKSTADQKSKK